MFAQFEMKFELILWKAEKIIDNLNFPIWNMILKSMSTFMTSEQWGKEMQGKCKTFDLVDTPPAMHPFVAVSVGELSA